MRVRNGFSSSVRERAACCYFFIRADNLVFQSYHHGNRLDHRTRFIAEYGMVDAFKIYAVLLCTVEVGNGLDVACGNFHQNGRTPFGFRLGEHFQQFVFQNVLHLHVDGSLDVVAFDR